MSGRGGRWRPPPPPPPRILHLPRRSRRSRTTKPSSLKPSSSRPQLESAGWNLGTLFSLEQSFNGGERRGRVEESMPPCESVGDSGEERWRVEAEILRAECNFLRMEREVALQRLERNRSQAEAALRSAVESLVSARKKIEGVGGAVETVLEEEIEELEEKLAKLQGNERSGCSIELHKSCRSNFDRQASVLRRRLEKMTEETCEKEIREIAVLSTLPSNQEDYKEDEAVMVAGLDQHCRFQEVEMLRTKMEGLSKGMLERVEEYDYLLSAKATNVVTSTTPAKCRSGCQGPHTEMAGSERNHHERQPAVVVEEKGGEPKEIRWCSCKELVGRIVEQLRAEMEQWAEMQAMLEHVGQEMEELRSSRDLWQRRATSADLNLCSMRNHMLEWKQKATTSENKATELKKRIVELKFELQTVKAELLGPSNIPASRIHTDIWNSEGLKLRGQQQKSQDSHKENEKHVLVCRLKNPKSGIPKRSPFQEIGNLTLRRI